MENHRTSELIKLDALGIISERDSAELLKLIQNNKNFPWKEMGAFQNLAALLAIMVEPEKPPKKIKENLIAYIESNVVKDLVIEDDSIKIDQPEELKINELTTVQENKKQKSTLTFKEPDLTSLEIFNHVKDFEEVKSRASRVKERLKENPPAVKPKKSISQKESRTNRYSDKPGEQFNKEKKSKKIPVLIISSVVLALTVAGIVIMNSSNPEIESQKSLTDVDNQLLISKSKVNPEESELVVPAQNNEPAETDINLTGESQSGQEINLPDKEEKKSEVIEKSTEKKETKEISNEKKDTKIIPPPKTPKLIEAKLVSENENQPEEKTEEKSLVVENKPPPKEEKPAEQELTYFVAVEEMPEPIGGLSAIQSKIIYPELARKAGIQGKVFILAFVDESGNVTRAQIVKGIGLGCDEAALDAVMNTKFKPGKQRGKPIKVQITIPITFKL